MKKLKIAFASLLAVATLLSGCNAGKANSSGASGSSSVSSSSAASSSSSSQTAAVKKGGTLIVYTAGNPTVFNPDSRPDDNFYAPAMDIYSRLVKLNGNQQIIPDLAKSWDISGDGKTITFHLQKNVKWQDGVPFTSKDVKFTFDGIQQNKGCMADVLAGITSVTCPDDDTAVFHLKTADATLLGYLAWYGTFIVPEHVFGNGNWDQGTKVKPVGTGPFKFVSWQSGVSITLAKNADYFVQEPYLDQVKFAIVSDPTTALQSFKNGELDIGVSPTSGTDLTAMKKDSHYKTNPVEFPSRYYLLLNNKKGVFQDVKVRQAVAYALNNNELVAKATGNNYPAASTWITPLYSWALNKSATVPNNDISKAKSLLAEAGKSSGVTLKALVYDYGFYKPMTEVIKDELSKVGIKVDITVLELSSWSDALTKGDYDISIYGGYQGPDVGCLASRVETNADNNMEGYSNKTVDTLFEQAKQLSADSQKDQRAKLYQEIQTQLAKDVPFIPLCEDVEVTPAQSYVMGDPFNDTEAKQKCSFYEYTYTWLDK